MGPDQDVVAAVVAVAAPVVLSVGTVWLRLYFRLRGQRERRRFLLAAATLPAGSRLRDHRDDGTVLTVTVGAVHRPEDQR